MRNKLQIFLALIIVGSGFAFSQPSVRPDPRPTLEAFCKAEFECNEDSYAMVTLSKAHQALIRNKYPGEQLSIGDMIAGSYSCDHVMVASSYHILGITVAGITAKAEVEYAIVGEFKNKKGDSCADEFLPGTSKVQRVTMTLRYDNGKNGMGWIRGTAWYVEDPPVPKVSVEGLLLVCQKQLDKYRIIAKNAQKKGIDIPNNIRQGIETFEKKCGILNKMKSREAF